MKFNLFFAALVALAAMSFTTLSDNSRPWELLGARVVNYTMDHDEIVVTRAEGLFTALQIKAAVDGSRRRSALTLEIGRASCRERV